MRPGSVTEVGKSLLRHQPQSLDQICKAADKLRKKVWFWPVTSPVYVAV